MKILVINAGSSSLKYQLIDMENELVMAKGNCDRIGVDGHIKHQTHDGRVVDEDISFPTHTEAFAKLSQTLTAGEGKVIGDMSEISAVGHRVVQGAEKFSESVKITDEVISVIEDVSDLAPLHNPAHLLAIKACGEIFSKDVVQVAVFDTAFHQSMPPKAYMYGIPYEYYEKYHIRRYGFHGTSHRYVSARVAEIMGRDIKDLKIITCHLGNGSSIAAVDGGKSVDTTMGFTPLGGLMMGTRCGDLDPSIATYLMQKENLSEKEIDAIFNKKSGYLGVSQETSDHRDLMQAEADGNELAALALRIQRYQIKKYVGSYIAAMGGLDALVFTGGIGENVSEVRAEVCENMSFLGIEVDADKNKALRGIEGDISTGSARVRTFVIPTNEELTIARDTLEILKNS